MEAAPSTTIAGHRWSVWTKCVLFRTGAVVRPAAEALRVRPAAEALRVRQVAEALRVRPAAEALRVRQVWPATVERR